MRRRCYGRTDAGLSPEGRDHADAIASRLEGEKLHAVYSSPQRRAVQTATPIAVSHELRISLVDDLRELDFGEFEGRSYEEIEEAYPRLYEKWMADPTGLRFPGGEDFDQMRRRVTACIDRLIEIHADATIALVSHGGVNRIALAEALSVPKRNLFRISQDYGH